MVNKKKFPRDTSFVDKQGKFVIPGIDYKTRKSARVGKAYAFFDCEAPRKTIDDYLHGKLVEDSQECMHDFPKPSELEIKLSLEEVARSLTNKNIDPALFSFIKTQEIYPIFPSKYKALMKDAKPIKINDLKYVIRAGYYGGSNEDAAEKLEIVMNDVYLRFGDKKPFNVAIVGQDDSERYGFWKQS